MKAMPVAGVRQAKVTHPTGDPNFSVLQAFPAGFTAAEADPFLMCDEFGPAVSTGMVDDPDEFPVDWHPHRGMDLLTYMIKGVCRHADSMGNRESFPAPAMQWTSAGSGIEHAEGGGTPAGETNHGFQIWINVPSSRKMDDPAYGTHPTREIPVYADAREAPGVQVRVLAGPFACSGFETIGPFKTICDVQILDAVLEPGASFEHELPVVYDNCLIYAYGTRGIMSKVSGTLIKPGQIARMEMEAAAATSRKIVLEAGTEGLCVMIFAGKRLRQPIAWHGPFVMTTQVYIFLPGPSNLALPLSVPTRMLLEHACMHTDLMRLCACTITRLYVRGRVGRDQDDHPRVPARKLSTEACALGLQASGSSACGNLSGEDGVGSSGSSSWRSRHGPATAAARPPVAGLADTNPAVDGLRQLVDAWSHLTRTDCL